MIIYKITNIVNGKIYIGQTTKTAEERLRKHIVEARCEANGTRPNNYFHNAINKYGEENFVIEIIDSAETLDELFEKEDLWIERLNSTNKDIGYNLMTGGQSGKRGQSTYDKISKKKKENWNDPNLAKRMMDGLKSATKTWQKISMEKRIECTCLLCGKKFSLPKCEAYKRKFCSQDCANAFNIKIATQVASIRNHEYAEAKHREVYQDVIKWINENSDIILDCPKNSIGTRLIDLQCLLKEKHNISDWRTISKIICGNTSKKKMLEEMIQIVKRYAVPDQN